MRITKMSLRCANRKSANVLGVLSVVASAALDMTGFYYSGKPPVVKKRATQQNRTSSIRYRLYIICSTSVSHLVFGDFYFGYFSDLLIYPLPPEYFVLCTCMCIKFMTWTSCK